MRCPRCGSENPDENVFCQSCGAPLPKDRTGFVGKLDPNDPNSPTVRVIRQEKPRWAQAVSAVIRVLLYVGVMFGCQSCVISGYTANQMMSSGVPAAAEGLSPEYLSGLLEKVNENMTMILLIANLLTVLVVCLLFRLRGKNPRTEMGVYPVNPMRLPLFALFGTALNLFLSLLLPLLPIPESLLEMQEMQYGSFTGGSLFVELLSVGVVAGITEELIYRGIAMTRFLPIGGVFAVTVSSLIFGLSHGAPVAVTYAALIGVLFACLFRRYGSVVPGMICHIFFNMSNYWIPESGSPVLVPLFILSAVLIAACAYLFYFRRPSFLDAVNDLADRMPMSAEERDLVHRFREVQKSEGLDIDKAAAFEEEWKKLGKK